MNGQERTGTAGERTGTDGEEMVRVMDVEREGKVCTGDAEEVESMLDELRTAVFEAMEGTGEFLAVVKVRGMRRREFDGWPDWQGW